MESQSSEPRPQCPECGRVMRPSDGVIVVSDNDELLDDIIPDSMPLHPKPVDVFAGLYCCPDCILDAIRRGWPEHRCMTDGHDFPK